MVSMTDTDQQPDRDAPGSDPHADFHHVSVLPHEVLEGLAPRPGGRYIDATLGGGGHAAALLEASAPDGRLLGIDTDPAALAAAGRRLEPFGGRAALARGNFRDLERLAGQAGFAQVQGILIDLGVSSHQIDTPERGFSFQADAPLDMRLDPHGPTTAADLVNQTPERELADILYHYGEEHASRRIARFIAEARRARPIERTGELAELVARALGGRRGKIHPATRTFQALRIAVNGELESLEAVLPQALGLLAPGGRLALISFHSLEDRIVKQFFRAHSSGEQPALRLITKKPIEAGETELRTNPRSRSAKLRVAERR